MLFEKLKMLFDNLPNFKVLQPDNAKLGYIALPGYVTKLDWWSLRIDVWSFNVIDKSSITYAKQLT